MQAPITPPEPSSASPSSRLLDRAGAMVEVFAVAVLGSLFTTALFVLAGASPLADARHVAAFMWLEAVLTLTIITVLVRARGSRWRDFGWTAAKWRRETLLGIAVLPVLFAVTVISSMVFQAYWPELVTEKNPLLEMIKTRADLVLFLANSLFVGGVKEEVQRGFILTQFRRYLGGIWVGLLCWTVVFAALHYFQGLDKAVGAGLLGLVFGLLFVWRRNLISPIVAHACYDVVTLLTFWSIFRR